MGLCKEVAQGFLSEDIASPLDLLAEFEKDQLETLATNIRKPRDM